MSEVTKDDLNRINDKLDSLTTEFSRISEGLAVLSTGIARDTKATERRIIAIETAAGLLSEDVQFLHICRKEQLAKLAGAGMVVAVLASILTAIGMPLVKLLLDK